MALIPPHSDIQQILLEAKGRWLRPSEICEILRNYRRFNLTPDPPNMPSGGSLYLFDRKALRYFRKDGHSWKKKNDGKTVREAHERLKSGSVDVLQCYYAHGECNENFQRRCYWMLDEKLEHIVLVHYRDVTAMKEGSRPTIPRLVDIDRSTVDNAQGVPTTSTVCSTHLNSSAFTTRASTTSSSNTNWNRPTLSTEFEDTYSGDDIGGASISCSGFRIASLPRNDVTENNASGCSGSISHPYDSNMTDTRSLSRPFDPFLTNQMEPQNLTLNEDQQKNCGTSQPAGSFGGARFSHHIASSTCSENLSLNRKFTDLQEHNVSFEQPNCPDSLTRRRKKYLLDKFGVIKDGVDDGPNVLPDAHPQLFIQDGKSGLQIKEENSHSPFDSNHTQDDSVHMYQVPLEQHFYIAPQFKHSSRAQVNNALINQKQEHKIEGSYCLKNAPESVTPIDELGELKKLDSFGRWMNKEIGKDCDDSLMASDSCNYWNTLDEDKEVSSLSPHMQLDNDSLGPSLSHIQLFSILDFSPDWAYSGNETKVLIAGTFLGSTESGSIKWCCMFGEHEVSAEVLTTNVIRCQAPPHAPGRIPFYITRSDRQACSEVREFEYRENLSGATLPLALKGEPEEEIHLQVRFAKMLSLGIDRKMLVCSIENCHKCKLKASFSSLLSNNKNEWDKIEEDSKAFRRYHMTNRVTLLQKLFKDMLYEWLVCKSHEEGKGPNVLDEQGQGVIHLAAALGYEWAMSPIVVAGVHPSFRDAHGRAALHWAAYFGREETVVALVRVGAAPGAVEDPTSKFPEGQTAADLASSRGHKGIAGYLAEAALISHLSSLAVTESVMDSVSANLAAEKAIETVQEQKIVPLDGDKKDHLALRGSLAAVRNSAQAAARIQAAFRVHSFRQRQLTEGNDENNVIAEDALVLSALTNKVHRTSHFTDHLHIAAAVKIQQKYRGFKERRNYLRNRNQIVKIQAHVRGHQVRKHYKHYRKVVWSVSILEKAILRWRRKRSGLRGFRSEETACAVEKAVEKTEEYEFLRHGRKQKVAVVEKALARVQSMARYPEARDQYMRLVACSHKSKLADGSSSSGEDQHTGEEGEEGR